jgi:hypothetical protein
VDRIGVVVLLYRRFPSRVVVPLIKYEFYDPLFVPFLLDQSDASNSISNQTSLTHQSDRSPPFPIGQSKVIALFHQQLPDLCKQSDHDPMRKGSVQCRVVLLDPQNMIQFTPSADPKNDVVHYLSRIDTRFVCFLQWINFRN